MTQRHNNRAHQQHKEGLLVGVKRANQFLYPGFQFHDGEVLPIMATMAADAAKYGCRESDVLLWMCSPTAALPNDDRPVDLLATAPKQVAATATTLSPKNDESHR